MSANMLQQGSLWVLDFHLSWYVAVINFFTLVVQAAKTCVPPELCCVQAARQLKSTHKSFLDNSVSAGWG